MVVTLRSALGILGSQQNPGWDRQSTQSNRTSIWNQSKRLVGPTSRDQSKKRSLTHPSYREQSQPFWALQPLRIGCNIALLLKDIWIDLHYTHALPGWWPKKTQLQKMSCSIYEESLFLDCSPSWHCAVIFRFVMTRDIVSSEQYKNVVDISSIIFQSKRHARHKNTTFVEGQCLCMYR